MERKDRNGRVGTEALKRKTLERKDGNGRIGKQENEKNANSDKNGKSGKPGKNRDNRKNRERGREEGRTTTSNLDIRVFLGSPTSKYKGQEGCGRKE